MASDKSLAGLLGQLETELAEFGAPIVGSFQPGLADDGLTATLAAEGLACPDDLRTWFGWHNGPRTSQGFYDDVAETMLAVGWHMMPLADALDARRWWLNTFATPPMPDQSVTLQASWLPLLSSNGMYLNAGTASAVLPLPLVGQTHPENLVPQFPSLRIFVLALVRVFKEGLALPDSMEPGAAWADLDTTTAPDLRALTLLVKPASCDFASACRPSTRMT